MDGSSIYERVKDQLTLAKPTPVTFSVDWFIAALPILHEKSQFDPLFIFKNWLAHAILLRPVPSLINGESEVETLQPRSDGSDLGAWFSGLMASSPDSYSVLNSYLTQLMPDLKSIKNPLVGQGSHAMEAQFSAAGATVSFPFRDLSDGEKCFIICALVLAANSAYGPLLCFWDEPDNFLAPSEVAHFIIDLRKAFHSAGQFIMTSHNIEAIRRFSDDNTFVLHRKDHFAPVGLRLLSELEVHGDLIDTILLGELEP